MSTRDSATCNTTSTLPAPKPLFPAIPRPWAAIASWGRVRTPRKAGAVPNSIAVETATAAVKPRIRQSRSSGRTTVFVDVESCCHKQPAADLRHGDHLAILENPKISGFLRRIPQAAHKGQRGGNEALQVGEGDPHGKGLATHVPFRPQWVELGKAVPLQRRQQTVRG